MTSHHITSSVFLIMFLYAVPFFSTSPTILVIETAQWRSLLSSILHLHCFSCQFTLSMTILTLYSDALLHHKIAFPHLLQAPTHSVVSLQHHALSNMAELTLTCRLAQKCFLIYLVGAVDQKSTSLLYSRIYLNKLLHSHYQFLFFSSFRVISQPSSQSVHVTRILISVRRGSWS